jgi:hypothetical protein
VVPLFPRTENKNDAIAKPFGDTTITDLIRTIKIKAVKYYIGEVGQAT